MASLVVHSNGYLLIQFRYKGRLCREFLGMRDTRDNRRIGEQKVKDLQAALRRGDFDYSKFFPDAKWIAKFTGPKPETAETYWNRWLGTLQVSKGTLYDYECIGRAFLGSFKDKRLNEVSASDLREAIKAHVEQDKPRRAVMFLQRMRSMFDAALEDGLIAANPARRVRNPRSRKRREQKQPLEPHEVVAIRAVATGQDLNLIDTLLGTGARPGEILATRAPDVDFKTRRLTISGSVGRWGESAGKTELAARVVELDNLAHAALKRQAKVVRLRAPLFANAAGDFVDWTNWRDRHWKKILRAAKVPYRNPYIMRHTYAVQMLRAGRDPIWLARQMGHTSPQMIYRHYARWVNLPENGSRASGQIVI